MANLIRANAYRLVRSRLFWLVLILSAVPGIVFLIHALPHVSEGREALEMYSIPTDLWVLVNLGPIFLAYAASLMCPAFDGGEFTNGGLRNKLTRGCSRASVFLSSLLAELLALGCFLVAYYASFFVLWDVWNGPQIANTGWTPSELLLIAVLCAVCFTCLSHLIGTLLNGRASLIGAPLVLIVLTIASMTINVRLLQPETYTVHSAYEEQGEVVSMDAEVISNPNYVPESQRPMYEFFQHALPTGAAVAGLLEVNDSQYWPYLAADCVLFAVAGVLVFSRRNLE